jgi:hypothetical protein
MTPKRVSRIIKWGELKIIGSVFLFFFLFLIIKAMNS